MVHRRFFSFILMIKWSKQLQAYVIQWSILSIELILDSFKASKSTEILDQRIQLDIQDIGLSISDDIQLFEILYISLTKSDIVWTESTGRRIKPVAKKISSGLEEIYLNHILQRELHPEDRSLLTKKYPLEDVGVRSIRFFFFRIIIDVNQSFPRRLSSMVNKRRSLLAERNDVFFNVRLYLVFGWNIPLQSHKRHCTWRSIVFRSIIKCKPHSFRWCFIQLHRKWLRMNLVRSNNRHYRIQMHWFSSFSSSG